MLQNGIVKQTGKQTAEVEIRRSSACGESCASCGLCPGQTTVVTAFNDAGAAVGDTVSIDLADKKILSAVFLVYIVPLIALIAGYFIGYAIWERELAAVASSFALMAITFALIAAADRKLKKKYTPRVVSILTGDV